MKFPTVPGKDTNGRKLKLPDDLDGEQTLLVVSFHQRQRSLVGSWRGLSSDLCDRFEHFAYYELVVVGSRRGMLPPSSSGGMTPTNARTSRHKNTLLLSVDKQAFRRRLGIIDEETIYAFLLEGDRVVRQEAGVLTPATGDALESLLRAYRDEKGRSGGAASPGESSS
ncbi:hypothetical protein [Halobellus ordinarius]|uniref:hypothetical protein n=1 Tax=Halobellus ordinarius TaxID=3075120 RepID=UPI002880108A|nr:hypothetical protein [Halobellus sp. ZY16]